MPCWVKDPWLPTVPVLLEDVPHWCISVKDLIKDVSFNWSFKGLQSLYLTLWLFKDMCCPDRVSLPPSVSSGKEN